MKNLGTSLFLVLLAAACTSNPIPDDYSGPLAHIQDSAVSENDRRVQFFYVRELDGKKIDNVLFVSDQAHQGKGFSPFKPVPFSRDVPAKPSALLLEGRVRYMPPIMEIINAGTVYTVEKQITFTPESNHTYVVKGVLTPDRKDVWLEDAQTGKRIE